MVEVDSISVVHDKYGTRMNVNFGDFYAPKSYYVTSEEFGKILEAVQNSMAKGEKNSWSSMKFERDLKTETISISYKAKDGSQILFSFNEKNTGQDKTPLENPGIVVMQGKTITTLQQYQEEIKKAGIASNEKQPALQKGKGALVA